MKNLKLLSLVVAVLAVACDPYSKTPGGSASTMFVVGSSGNGSATPVDATVSGTTYTIAADAYCNDSTMDELGPVLDQSIAFVVLNRQIDGATVQATTLDCTPTGGWLTGVGSPAITGGAWYACYNPSSPSPDQGGSIVMFYTSAANPDGWGLAEPLPASNATGVTYTLTGSVLTAVGANTVVISAPANVDPGSAIYVFTSAVDTSVTLATDTTVTLTLTTPTCGDANTTFKLERAANKPGVNGAADAPDATTWVTLDNSANTKALSFVDTGLTAGTKYWYKVTPTSAAGGEGAAVTKSVTTKRADDVSAVTFASIAQTTLTVNWTTFGAAGAAYRVERAPNKAGTGGAPDKPGTYAVIAASVAGTTYADTGLTAGTKYWYRVRSTSSTGVVDSASVTTLP